MTDAFESKTTRFYFDDLTSAAKGLLAVILHARTTDDRYSFGGLNAQSVLTSGLTIEGEIDGVAAEVEKVVGSTRYDD